MDEENLQQRYQCAAARFRVWIRGSPGTAQPGARIGKKDRPKIDPFSIQDAEVLIAAIHRDWGEAQGNYDEFRFFTGLRPSEQIALVVTDYDAVYGVLSVTKACVAGIDRDRAKIAEDRRVVLSPRARAVLARQLRLLETLQRQGRLDHDHLFFHWNGAPIRRLHAVYRTWRHTLTRLAIRYRKPYTARHSSVSWTLMIGRNPLLVAQQRGHSLITLLSVYAAWTEGRPEADISAIRRAMRASVSAAKGTQHAGLDSAVALPIVRSAVGCGMLGKTWCARRRSRGAHPPIWR